jgi:hypothetical protein
VEENLNVWQRRSHVTRTHNQALDHLEVLESQTCTVERNNLIGGINPYAWDVLIQVYRVPCIPCHTNLINSDVKHPGAWMRHALALQGRSVRRAALLKQIMLSIT